MATDILRSMVTDGITKGTASKLSSLTIVPPTDAVVVNVTDDTYKTGDGTTPYNLLQSFSLNSAFSTASGSRKVFTASGTIHAGDIVSVVDNDIVTKANNSTADWYVGIATGVSKSGEDKPIVNDGELIVVDILTGVNKYQTGLTCGEFYYVSDTGTITTTNTGRLLGRALSDTSIMITQTGYGSGLLLPPPNRPSNVSPSSGVGNQLLTPTLTISPFSGSGTDTHRSTRFKIYQDAAKTILVHDSGILNITDQGSGVSDTGLDYIVPSSVLNASTTYYWEASVVGNYSRTWSEYSTITSFTTGANAGYYLKTTPGTYRWTVPSGVTLINVYAACGTASSSFGTLLSVVTPNNPVGHDITISTPSGVTINSDMSISLNGLHAIVAGGYAVNGLIPVTPGDEYVITVGGDDGFVMVEWGAHVSGTGSNTYYSTQTVSLNVFISSTITITGKGQDGTGPTAGTPGSPGTTGSSTTVTINGATYTYPGGNQGPASPSTNTLTLQPGVYQIQITTSGGYVTVARAPL